MSPARQQSFLFELSEDPPVTERGDGVTAPELEAEAADSAADDEQGAPELAGKSVHVVDAHALIYQVFHAMPEMTGPAGQPVGAIHGFIRDVIDLIEKKKPDMLLCAFDHSDVTFRNEIYDGYKKSRAAMPDDLRPQIPNIQRFLDAIGVPVLICPGYEADDILATAARIVADEGGRCVLVTHDKDCRQLIGDRVVMYNIRKDEELDAAALLNDWGVRPDQVVDFQSLVGDSTDDIPGVPGIGKKTARDLLQQYDTLDTLLEKAADEQKGKRRENLVNFREQALTSRRLVRLDAQAPIDIDWRAARVGGVKREAIRELCREFGFRRLADRIEQLVLESEPDEWKADYRIAGSLAELDELIAELSRQEQISIDTETTDSSPRDAEIVGYSFAFMPGQAWYVPVRAPAGDPRIDPAAALERLKPLLEDPRVRKIGQNIKYDMIVLRAAGVNLAGAAFDTMVADYLLAPGERNHSVDDLSRRYLGHETTTIKTLIGSGKKQKRMDQVPVAIVAPYAGEDADVPLRLFPLLRRRLEEETGLAELYHGLEMPLIDVLVEMEFHGIKIDAEKLHGLSGRYAERLRRLETEIHALAGRSFNIDSPKQLAAVLFEDLGLPVSKKTKTGPSTDVEVLEELARGHELPARIVLYRQAAKLKGTYIDALPLLVSPRTGRVHTSFKQDVAATGRLSSSDPNLQNIPIRTEEGREIRSAFIAGEPGWKLLCADYSQIELRVLAHFTGDDALLAAFAEDRDIHAIVAAEVYGVGLSDVTAEMRRSAKAINFGIIYGQSPFGLAKSLGIEKEDAAAFIDAYFARYGSVDEFMEKVLAKARQNGYVTTISGRRRAIEGVRDPRRRSSSRFRNLPERIAVNTVIQGSAADIIKQAMVATHGRMRREGCRARMLLQIHDELVFESPPEELPSLAALVEQEMSRAAALSVPLKVDLKSGENWAECD